MHHLSGLILDQERPKTTGRDLYPRITVFGTRLSGTGSPACRIITGLLQDLPRHKGAPDRHPSPFHASTPIMKEPDMPTRSQEAAPGSILTFDFFFFFDRLSGSILWFDSDSNFLVGFWFNSDSIF